MSGGAVRCFMRMNELNTLAAWPQEEEEEEDAEDGEEEEEKEKAKKQEEEELEQEGDVKQGKGGGQVR